jgi:hypothetical protein
MKGPILIEVLHAKELPQHERCIALIKPSVLSERGSYGPVAIIIHIDLLHGARRTCTYRVAGPRTRMAPVSLSVMNKLQGN